MGIKAQAEGPETATPRSPSAPARRPKPGAGPRMRVVWAVCDLGGRPVATFEYPQKAEAEALIAKLKAQGKGAHFLRSVKEPMAT
jgi:hypothetical protein